MANLTKMNVLVYTGTGTTAESVRHCIATLRHHLSPNYAVIPITDQTVREEPWASTCALFVMPGGADMGYCQKLNGTGNDKIKHYVFYGGAYLGFCAGGYYGSQECEFEIGNRYMEVVGLRELAFYPGICRGGAFPGFAYSSEWGARAAKLIVNPETFKGIPDISIPEWFNCYYNGGGVFVRPEDFGNTVQIVAEYADEIAVESGAKKAAVVYTKVGDGRALLTGPHPEFAAANLRKQPNVPGYDQLIRSITQHDSGRSSFVEACLVKLGLKVNKLPETIPTLSKLFLSARAMGEVSRLTLWFQAITEFDGADEFIRDEGDLFHLEEPGTEWSANSLSEALVQEYERPKKESRSGTPDPTAEYRKVPKRMVVVVDGWPGHHETPTFDHTLYYNSLDQYRGTDPEAETWGSPFLYGSVVTSTNTLLERNPKLLSTLPTGFTIAATTQIAGRGRGSNVWVSPPGCLIMSTVINHPAKLVNSHPFVFIQYLAALAIVEGIKSYDADLYNAMPIKLKWPNDIYALDPSSSSGGSNPNEPPKYVKIGGILANCSYTSGTYQVVLGIGLNVDNARPTTGLNALLAALPRGTSSTSSLKPFRIEQLVARIVTRLEVVYKQFMRVGFSADLEARYYAHWLHGGQIITLETEGGARARVLGIDRASGMLLAVGVNQDGRPTGQSFELRSNENSFDFFKGLIKRKL